MIPARMRLHLGRYWLDPCNGRGWHDLGFTLEGARRVAATLNETRGLLRMELFAVDESAVADVPVAAHAACDEYPPPEFGGES